MQNGVTNMKKVFILILIILGIKNGCYAEEIKMDKKLQDGMNYYFEKLIPMYYKGQTFEKERNLLIRNCGVHMTGTNEDTIHTVKGTKDIVYNYEQKHIKTPKKESFTCIRKHFGHSYLFSDLRVDGATQLNPSHPAFRHRYCFSRQI